MRDSAWPPDEFRVDSTSDSAQSPGGLQGVAYTGARTRVPASRPDPIPTPTPPVDTRDVSGAPVEPGRGVEDGVGGGVSVLDAEEALRARGVNSPGSLLEYGQPWEIVLACERWDRQHGVSPGLLVSWIRNREFGEPPRPAKASKTAILQARFDEYARRYPEGSAPITHAQLDRVLRPGNADDCPGRMVVQTTTYPVIALECDTCWFEQGVPARGLHVLGPPGLALTTDMRGEMR